MNTRRPYTFRLRGANAQLYATHVALNAGAEAALEWLLTLRGGLSSRRALTLTGAAQREAMTMLARCWFVAEIGSCRAAVRPTADRIRAILSADGVAGPIVEEWIAQVTPLFTAPIREDATWVDRRSIFAAEEGLGQEALDDTLFASQFFSQEDFLSFRHDRSVDCIQAARGWLSRRLGSGQGADFGELAVVYARLAAIATPAPDSFAEIVARFGGDPLPQLRAPGHRSRTLSLLSRIQAGTIKDEERELFAAAASKDAMNCAGKPAKGARPWASAFADRIARSTGLSFLGDRDHLNEYAVILDHALRRLSSYHAAIGRAEVARLEARATREALRADLPIEALAWLDHYRSSRAASLMSEDVRIDDRSIRGWHTVLGAWRECPTASERVSALRKLQGDGERLGDLTLFTELANDDAAIIRDMADILERYARIPEPDGLVPAIRHIDAHRQPIWADYGTSRLSLRQAEGQLEMATIAGRSVVRVTVRAGSHRARRDLPVGDVVVANVPRADSLSRYITDMPDVVSPAITNGKLMASRHALAAIGACDPAARQSAIQQMEWQLSASLSLEMTAADPRIVERLRSLKGTVGRQAPASGIPGLRVLGVHLGLRHGASVAVLETGDGESIAGPKPAEKKQHVTTQADGRAQHHVRIGASAWARIEAAWTLSLPGEKKRERRAPHSDEEAWAIALVESLGGSALSPSVTMLDLLRSIAAATARALRANSEFVRLLTRLRDAAPEAGAIRAAAMVRVIERLGDAAPRAIEERRALRGIVHQLTDPETMALSGEACEDVASALERLWNARDTAIRGALRQIREKTRDRRGIRHIGGLSLDRLGLLDQLYRLSRSYGGRPRPAAPLGEVPQVRRSERLRIAREAVATERVRLIAHGIAAAALGGERNGSPTPRSRVHAPCSVVALEDLTLRAQRGNTRRSNRAIRTLAPARVMQIIRDVCTLYGLLVVTVPAAYATRVHALTGEPLLRVNQVPVARFIASSARPLRTRLAAAYRRAWDERARIWSDRHGIAWHHDGASWTRGAGRAPDAVLIPAEFGALGVDRHGRLCDAAANAAANAALDAVRDRAWTEGWSRVSVDGRGRASKPVAGSPTGVLLPEATGVPTIAWRTEDGSWLSTSTYWREAEMAIETALLRRVGACVEVA